VKRKSGKVSDILCKKFAVVQPSGSTVYKFDTGRVRLWFGARAALLEAFDPLVAFNPTSRGSQSVSAFDAQGEILALMGFNGFEFLSFG
jgi:hypothetical protein